MVVRRRRTICIIFSDLEKKFRIILQLRRYSIKIKDSVYYIMKILFLCGAEQLEIEYYILRLRYVLCTTIYQYLYLYQPLPIPLLYYHY